jgi:ribonuclease III
VAVRYPLRTALRQRQVKPEDLQSLTNALGHEFIRPELLEQALTHPSTASKATYERLEFLGDRVLGLIIAALVYRAFPAEPEGALARRFAALVRKEALARVAEAIDLGVHLRISRGEAEQGGRRSRNLLADACEALIAALFLDGGYEAAQSFVERWWRPLLAEQAEPPQDTKTALQEWAQSRGLPLPVYRLTGQEGPAHDPIFDIEVSLPGQPSAHGRGRSRRTAELAAAELLLSRLRSKTGA